MLAVSTTSMSSGAEQRPQQQHPAAGEIDAAALDLLWGDAGGVLPPLSSSDVGVVDVGVAGPSSSNAAGKRPAVHHHQHHHHPGVDASALGVLDGSIAEHLAYEYGTRTPGDTARPAPPPEEDEGDDDDENEGGSGDGGGGGAGNVDADADADGNTKSNRGRKAQRTGARKTASGPSESAARAKANRERARRERLNDFFAELVRVMAPCLNPSGETGTGGGGASTSGAAGGAAAAGNDASSSGGASASAAAAAHNLVRTDKTSVVADAIRLITALRAENGQLKQLNKFMEQRLATVERERAELLMRAAYAAGVVAQNQNNNNGPSTSTAGPSSAAAAAPAPAAAPPLDAAAAVAMLPPPWLPPSDLDTSLDGSKRPPAA